MVVILLVQQINYTVYPIPFDDNLTIEIDLPYNKEFRIYSNLDELVPMGRMDSDINPIDLSSLLANIYVLNIENQSIKLLKTE